MKFKIILISTMLLLLGCSLINGPSKPTPNIFENFSYPLEVGNVWTYEKTFTYSNIRPDTIQPWFPLVKKGSVVIEVSSYDSLNANLGAEAYVLEATTVDSLSKLLFDSATFYFNNKEDGLYDYSGNGTNMALPISQPLTEKEIRDRFHNKLHINNSHAVTAFSPLRRSLIYPISLNATWVYEAGVDFGISKKVIRFDTLTTKAGRYNCFVVEWIYSLPSINTKVTDYYSAIGLIKRTVTVKDVKMTDMTGGNEITVDIIEDYLLVEFNQAQLP